MVTADLILGFLLTRLLSKPETKSPAVVFPPGGGTPTVPPTSSTPAPSTPASKPPIAAPATPQLPAPTFPTQVTTPPVEQKPTAVPAGFKRAVEVWIVQPAIANQAGQVLGAAPRDVQLMGAALSLQALEAQFPKGWQGAKSATTAEAMQAKALLSKWKDGGVIFMGPATLRDRRAYRMTKHPASTVPTTATPAPTSVPTTPARQPPAATVPASFPTPAAKPPVSSPAPSKPPAVVTTLPEVLITADAPQATPAPSTPAQVVRQVTAVRRGEGLAQVAKRLGRPENAVSAGELKKANVPNGPDNVTWQATDLSKGGLKKLNRAGGLQPGDRLFVPEHWGTVDVSRL